MAFTQRKVTSWSGRVGDWVVAAASFILEVLGSFLNFKKEDGVLAKGKKTANLLVRRVAYLVADYGLTAVSAAIVVAAKTLGASFLETLIAMWVFDFVVAGVFVVFFEKTGEDLSLGVDFRRAVDTIRQKSRVAGYVAVLLVVGQAIFWTGPEKIVTFFRKEIRTVPRVVALLLLLTAIQSLIWTFLYGLGYDVIRGWF